MEHNRVIYERPYDAEVEYLESGNTQFIDTGIIATNNTNFKMKVYTDSIQRQIFGQYKLTQSQYLSFGIFFFNNANKLVLYGVNNTYLPTRGSITDKLVEIELRDNKFILDSSVFDVTRNNVIGNKTLYLFKLNGLEISPNSHLKVYYCKIWNEDTLVRDFIPVRKGSTGFMYDKVSKKLFGNQGTGNFILGQDIPNPVPNIRRVFRFGNKRFVMPMPYDSKIEYLESSGTQWVDTGIIPDSEHKYEVTVSKTADNTAEVVPLGSWNAWQNAMFGSDIKNSTVGIYILWGSGSHQTNIITNDWITLYGEKGLSKATLISTGEVLASRNFEGNFTCNQSAYLFALNRNGSVVYRGSCKISRAKIWNGDTLVRDFIPVRRGNVGYLYDKVSGKLFGNSGTGQFILGNDIND